MTVSHPKDIDSFFKDIKKKKKEKKTRHSGDNFVYSTKQQKAVG